jgi:hypothetical protein
MTPQRLAAPRASLAALAGPTHTREWAVSLRAHAPSTGHLATVPASIRELASHQYQHQHRCACPARPLASPQYTKPESDIHTPLKRARDAVHSHAQNAPA